MMGEENGSPIGERKTCPSPDCQYDKSKAQANFCILCGTLLYGRCEDCLAENPMYAKFCHYCGANLDELREQRAPSQKGGLGILDDTDRPPEETEEEDENKGNAFDIS